MSDWKRKVDPGFYVKEASLLGVASDFTPFNVEDSLRREIHGDRVLRAVLNTAFALVSVAASGFGSLQSAGQWHLVFALTTLAVFTCYEPMWFTLPGAQDSAEAIRRQRRRFASPLALVLVLSVGPAAFAGTADAARVGAMAAGFLLVVWWLVTTDGSGSKYLVTVLTLTAFAVALILLMPNPLTRPAPALILAPAATVFVALVLLRRNRPQLSFSALACRLAALVLIVALIQATLSEWGPGGFNPEIYWIAGLAAAIFVTVLFAQESNRLWVGAPWNLFLTVILIHLWSMSQPPAMVARSATWQIATFAAEYCLLCIVAARLLRCQIAGRPGRFGVVAPLARVPLLDRSSHFALETQVA